ncbi:MAG: DNA primase [Kiritimatiellae bacterium]|nr:DNA primase [Kiritimatiellia bacterium]
MGNIISKNVLENIRLHNDIVGVIGNHIPLKKAGSIFKTLCPFHKEKTPSFTINPQRQIFHCFGCGEGGDIFAFVMKYEGVDFVTAVRILADKAGIQVLLEQTTSKGGEGDKDTLYTLLDKLALFYQEFLMQDSAASVAQAYLQGRHLERKMISTFTVGYAPDRQGLLKEWGHKNGYTVKQLERVGMMGKSESSSSGPFSYERFRNRLMFPIRDELGRVIGFSGRILDKNARVAKYINSPETVLFKKSRVLYGLDQARRAMVDRREAIVCEGQIDVIRCQEAGVKNVVAPQGTALTEDHAHILKRYADSIVLVFDADTAGQKAALRSAEIFLATGLSLKLVSLPQGEDPDSLIQSQGAQTFLDRLSQAQTVVDYQIDVLGSTFDSGDEAGVMRTARSVLEMINRTPIAVQRDQLIQRAVARLGISEQALRHDLKQFSRKRYTFSDRPTEAPRPTDQPPEERALVELLLIHPTLNELIVKFISVDDLTDPICRKIVEQMVVCGHRDYEAVLDVFQGEDSECLRLIACIHAENRGIDLDETSLRQVAQDLVLVIRRKALERQRNKLRSELSQVDRNDKRRIQNECSQLSVLIHNLRQGWEKALPILEFDG